MRGTNLVARVGDARHAAGRASALWPAQVTVLATIVLYLALPEKLTIGPRWLLPACEGALLMGLVAASPRRTARLSARRRNASIALVGLVSAVNLYSLVELAHFLLKGGKAGGHALILSGVVLWITNVLLFGVWYWELDRDGPVARLAEQQGAPDFYFPQMSDERWAPADWRPGFIDYLYVSFTNATAFSPTDTMPLSQSAKVLMTAQALASLVTVGLVVARAVNILA